MLTCHGGRGWRPRKTEAVKASRGRLDSQLCPGCGTLDLDAPCLNISSPVPVVSYFHPLPPRPKRVAWLTSSPTGRVSRSQVTNAAKDAPKNQGKKIEKPAPKNQGKKVETPAGKSRGKVGKTTRAQDTVKDMRYCSVKCLYGLKNGGPVDDDCPNISHHPRKDNEVEVTTRLQVPDNQVGRCLGRRRDRG